MNKFFFTFFVFACLNGKSQSLLDSLSNPGFTLQDSVGDKLAELMVIRNPFVTVMDKQVEADMYEWKRTRSAWLGNLTTSFNLNEGNLRAQDSAIANVFYPRYNLNLTVPMSTFFSRPKETKKAKAIYEGSIASKELGVIQLKEKIKLNYKAYQTNKYLLALQENVLQDESILLSQVQQKFKKNEVSLEVFTVASKRYNAELTKKLTLLLEVDRSKIALESSLGMNLDAALGMIRNR